MNRPPCVFCGEPNRDPGGSGYCLACRGTDWFIEARQQGSNDGYCCWAKWSTDHPVRIPKGGEIDD